MLFMSVLYRLVFVHLCPHNMLCMCIGTYTGGFYNVPMGFLSMLT